MLPVVFCLLSGFFLPPPSFLYLLVKGYPARDIGAVDKLDGSVYKLLRDLIKWPRTHILDVLVYHL